MGACQTISGRDNDYPVACTPNSANTFRVTRGIKKAAGRGRAVLKIGKKVSSRRNESNKKVAPNKFSLDISPRRSFIAVQCESFPVGKIKLVSASGARADRGDSRDLNNFPPLLQALTGMSFFHWKIVAANLPRTFIFFDQAFCYLLVEITLVEVNNVRFIEFPRSERSWGLNFLTEEERTF